MNAKSNIFKQLEIVESRTKIKDFILRLFEAYDIDDIVVGTVNSNPVELTEGFITEMKSYDDIDECLSCYNPNTDCIRIFESKYHLGKFKSNVMDCTNNSMNIKNFRTF